MNEMDISSVKRIALDETSSRKGHDYITLFVDVDTKRVLFATEGKDAETMSLPTGLKVQEKVIIIYR